VKSQTQRIAANHAAHDAAEALRIQQFESAADLREQAQTKIDKALGRPGLPFVAHHRNGNPGSECFKMLGAFDSGKEYFKVWSGEPDWPFCYFDTLEGSEKECRQAVCAFYGIDEIPAAWGFGRHKPAFPRLSSFSGGFIPE
jgi:hypothetical protein